MFLAAKPRAKRQGAAKGAGKTLLCGPQGPASGKRKILAEAVFTKTRFQEARAEKLLNLPAK
ncbi:hypothetical protein DWV29_11880 [Enterocloster asparagiformis]|uniref:Uncharacterized protein n=1 Tax=Enterocloster asparagiformis TaxID=333367 RepID=A0A413FFB8_9FIRM|nr:hypothetical protein DWV29_11880 [Enterocloster asparagiformis]